MGSGYSACSTYTQKSAEAKETYVKQEPYVGNNAIYVPCHEYVPKGCASAYKALITKELFVEAYNKWIKGE